jgi:hypothetical protein
MPKRCEPGVRSEYLERPNFKGVKRLLKWKYSCGASQEVVDISSLREISYNLNSSRREEVLSVNNNEIIILLSNLTPEYFDYYPLSFPYPSTRSILHPCKTKKLRYGAEE